MCRNPKSREIAVLAETDKDSVTGVVAIPDVIFFPAITHWLRRLLMDSNDDAPRSLVVSF